MKSRALAVVGAVAVVAAVALWATVTWVPSNGALQVWTPKKGFLRVPARGFALIPRWSGERSPRKAVVAEVRAATAEGANVDVTVALQPPVGLWHLQPASTVGEGLRRSIADPIRTGLAEYPLSCLLARTVPTGPCPSDPALELRRTLAMDLGLPEGSLEIELKPEADSVRSRAVARIAANLEIPRHKVLFLGLDGLDWDLVLPWVRSGRMPNLKRLMESGTWGRMHTLTPMASPLIWTTMATGVPPDVHGVLDFVETDPSSGQLVPVTGRSRKVPAIWNMASALNLKVGVVGWWASWPAERVDGTFVSDRLYYTLQQGVPREVFHEDPPDLVFPPERAEEFRALRDRAVTETDYRTIRYFMNISEEEFNRAVAADRGMEDPVDGLRRILAATRTYMGAGLDIAADRPDLLMVYLEGTDTIGHLLAPYMPPPTVDVDPAKAAVYAAAVPKYFEIVDRWIGRYLEACPLEEYAVILVSDHGFKWAAKRPRGLSGTAGPTAPLWHAEDASFVIAGQGVKALGEVREWASVYDIAPTLAALMGIPADPSWRTTLLPGCPPTDVAPVEWAPLLPPASYQQGGGGTSPIDPEFIAKLEALGYLGENGVSAAAATPQPAGTRAPATPTALPASITKGQINNLALIKINEKEYDEAERLLRKAIAMDPRYAAPHYNLRRMYMETGQFERADKELWVAIDKGLRDPERTLDRAAADYENLGVPERGEAILVRAIKQFPEHEPFYVHLMVLRVREGRFTEALPIGKVAAEKFPESGPVHAFYGLAAASAGQAELARHEIELSLAINPDQPTLRGALEQLP